MWQRRVFLTIKCWWRSCCEPAVLNTSNAMILQYRSSCCADPKHKVILLLLYNCHFATIMTCNVNIGAFCQRDHNQPPGTLAHTGCWLGVEVFLLVFIWVIKATKRGWAGCNGEAHNMRKLVRRKIEFLNRTHTLSSHRELSHARHRRVCSQPDCLTVKPDELSQRTSHVG